MLLHGDVGGVSGDGGNERSYDERQVSIVEA